jgi:hypothetical protein
VLRECLRGMFVAPYVLAPMPMFILESPEGRLALLPAWSWGLCRSPPCLPFVRVVCVVQKYPPPKEARWVAS